MGWTVIYCPFAVLLKISISINEGEPSNSWKIQCYHMYDFSIPYVLCAAKQISHQVNQVNWTTLNTALGWGQPE